jgi:hypothetical protein
MHNALFRPKPSQLRVMGQQFRGRSFWPCRRCANPCIYWPPSAYFLDIPDAWPRHLSAAADLAEAIPKLTVVLDHLGKPPLKMPDENAWRAQLDRFARLPNTVAKVSGLRLPGCLTPPMPCARRGMPHWRSLARNG